MKAIRSRTRRGTKKTSISSCGGIKLPAGVHLKSLVESIKLAFDLVWQRADSILENSDSVLILGKDTGLALERLKRIESKLQELGYFTYIIKEQSDKAGESIIQKVMRYALSSKFVLIENTEASGISTRFRM